MRLEKEIQLPAVEGRIDHLSIDVEGERLFVSALGNGSVEIIDLKLGQRIHEIKGLKEPQGVLYQGLNHRLFVASGGDGTVRSYDANSFEPLKSIELGDDADNLRYDSRDQLVLVGYGSGHLAALDSNLQKAFDVKLSAHPESFQLEQEGSRIFVNLPGSFGIAVLDRNKKTVIDKWHSASAAANFPMALDEKQKRLMIGYRVPPRLIVFNTDTGKVAAEAPIVGDTDDLFWDGELRQLYVIGGGGYVDVFRQLDGDRYERIARVSTAAGARTGLFVPALQRLFVAVPHRGSQAAKILVYQTDAAASQR